MPGPSTRPATPLSKDRIVDEAIALLADEGPDALSMRKLAQRMGTSTMSTYHHVADKEALVEAIADRIVSQLERPAPDADWADAVRTLAWSFRRLTLEHPAAFRVLLSGPRPTAMLRTADDVVALLVARGFGEDEALLVFRTFIRYLMGSTVAELGGFGGGTGARGPDAAERQFRYGLEAIIAGVTATASPARR
jgi:AcrR family transcriptional regulator